MRTLYGTPGMVSIANNKQTKKDNAQHHSTTHTPRRKPPAPLKYETTASLLFLTGTAVK